MSQKFKDDDQNHPDEIENSILEEIHREIARHDAKDKMISNIRFPGMAQRFNRKCLKARLRNTKAAAKSQIRQIDQDIRIYVNNYDL